MNAHEIAADFVRAMEAAGVTPAESIINELLQGQLVRFTVDGDRSGRRNGWARLFLDGRPAGAFGCNKRQLSEKWTHGDARQPYSSAERRAYAKAMASKRRAALESKAEANEAAAQRAAALLDRASDADPDHPYLTRKAIPAYGFYQIRSSLLVPMRDAGGRVRNVQFISPEGEKLFLKGGQTVGLCWSLRGAEDRAFVGEGVATMAAVRRATGNICYAAFSAGNLIEAARMVRLVHPNAAITICADDDAHLIDHPQIGYNVGVKSATAAAVDIAALIAMPPRPAGTSEAYGWDFADVGDDRAIRAALRQACQPLAGTASVGAFGSIIQRLEACA